MLSFCGQCVGARCCVRSSLAVGRMACILLDWSLPLHEDPV